MRAVVTGGTGHLGSRIVRQLVAGGADVLVTYRPGDHTTAIDDVPGLEHRPADLLDASAVTRALDGAEVVFHTAAMVVFEQAKYEVQQRVNIQGTRNVMDAARATGARRFVHTSTVSTLGIPAPGTIGDEDTAFNWGPYRMGYNDSKYASEQAVLEAARDDLDAVVLLPGTMFGPGDVNLNASIYIQLVERGPLVFAPPGGCCVVHVDDVARGHVLALEKGARGRRYVLGGEPLRFSELYRLIESRLNTGRTIRTLPRRLLLGLGGVSSFLRDRLRLPVPLTKGMTVAVAEHLAYSSARAERELGWTYRPAAEAIADAVRWYQERPEARSG